MSPLRAQDDEPPEPAGVVADEDAADEALSIQTKPDVYEPTQAERNQAKSSDRISLARNGKALVPIIIAVKAGPETRKYALELKVYLDRISGATFQIETSDGQPLDFSPYTGPRKNSVKLAKERAAQAALDKGNAQKPPEALPSCGIILGDAAEFSVPELETALACHDGFNGREAYAIRTTGQRILMLAAEERGVHHAVYRLLHELGCRWFATGEHWEIVPSEPNLSFGLDLTDRPTLAGRVIAFMDGAMSKETVNGKVYDEREAIANWNRRNGIGSSVVGSVAHSWHRIAEAYNDVLVEHPEYFAEVGGKRIQPLVTDPKTGKKTIRGVFAKFELANPAVRKMFVDFALHAFRKNPDVDMIPLSPTDGGGFSESAESRALGDVSDVTYGLINEVARAVAQEFPGKMIGIYAYREIAGPPSFTLESNVYVEVATLFNMSQYSNAQLMDLWPQRARHFGVYTYFSYYDADGSGLPGGPVSSIKYVTSVIPSYISRRALIVMAQSSDAWGPHLRGYYLAAKLLWNPAADAGAILDDFYEKAYGPAAPVMKRYHERIGRDAGVIITDQVLGAAFRDVDEAARIAQDWPEVQLRLNDIKQYLRWIHLSRRVAETPSHTPEERIEYRAKYEQMMRHAVAMRHTYMAQWNMIADRSGRRVAALFGDVSYIIASKRNTAKFSKIPGDRHAPNTWAGWVEATPEIIEAGFQESLKQLPDYELPQREFDVTDLVPVEFPPSPSLPGAPGTNPVLRTDYYQAGSPDYMVYSRTNETIEFQLQGGTRFRSPRPVLWSLHQSDGHGGFRRIEQGEVPADNTNRPVSIKVPGTGLYQLRAHAQNSGMRISYRTDRPFSMIWGATGSGAKDYSNPFFYVPKGTCEIVYYFNCMNGSGNTFLQPDGKTVPIIDGINTVPVPPGMDGKVWSMTRSKFRIQRFFNIPNVAAPSSDALLVPREIAIKDGLKIRP